MTPKGLASLLAACWTITALAGSAWLYAVWSISTPAIADTVKGVSTFNAAEPTPSLAPYPVFVTPANPNVLAKEYALYNPESGKTLLSKSGTTSVPIASTTKLMTVYLVATADAAELDQTVTVSQFAVNQPEDASVMGLVAGERITMRSLLYGAMLVSGGDATMMLAEIRGGELLGDPNATSEQKVDRFLQEMNAEAVRLHMDGTHYTDPTGYDVNTVSTAEDLAKVTYLVSRNDVLRPVIGTSDITLGNRVLHNSNRLLADAAYAGMVGGKTGYTDAAGHCLAAVAVRDGVTLVAIILHTNADTADASANEARKLLDIGFSNLTLK